MSASCKHLLSTRNSACLPACLSVQPTTDRGKGVSSTGRSSLHSSWHVRSDGGRDWLMAHGKHRLSRPIHRPPFTTLPSCLCCLAAKSKSPIVHWRPGAGLAPRACVLGISWYPTVSAWPLRAKTWGTTRRRPCKQQTGRTYQTLRVSPTNLM